MVVDVCTTTDQWATRFWYQRHAIFANGLHWLFYVHASNGNLVYRTSSDGTTWSEATTLRSCAVGYEFSLCTDGTYVHYVYGESSLYYRKGLLNSNGTITWSAGEQTIGNFGHNNGITFPSIVLDSDGYPYVIAGYGDLTGGENPNYTYGVKALSSSTKDGTWTTNLNYDLMSDETSDCRGTLVALKNRHVFFIYGKTGSSHYARTYSGSGWNSTVNWLTPYCVDSSGFYSIVEDDANDLAHIVYTDSAGNLEYNSFAFSTNSFGTAVTITSSLGGSAAVISRDGSTKLYVFYTSGNHVYYKTSEDEGATWSSATDWITDAGFVNNRMIGCFITSMSCYLGVYYLKGSGTYTLRYAFLATTTPIAINDTMGLSDGINITNSVLIAESLSLADIAVGAAWIGEILQKGIQDFFGFVDITTFSVVNVVNLQETISISENIIQEITAPINDGISLRDIPRIGVPTKRRQLVDNSAFAAESNGVLTITIQLMHSQNVRIIVAAVGETSAPVSATCGGVAMTSMTGGAIGYMKAFHILRTAAATENIIITFGASTKGSAIAVAFFGNVLSDSFFENMTTAASHEITVPAGTIARRVIQIIGGWSSAQDYYTGTLGPIQGNIVWSQENWDPTETPSEGGGGEVDRSGGGDHEGWQGETPAESPNVTPGEGIGNESYGEGGEAVGESPDGGATGGDTTDGGDRGCGGDFGGCDLGWLSPRLRAKLLARIKESQEARRRLKK